MQVHFAIGRTRLALAALGAGGLWLSGGCRSDDVQGPTRAVEAPRVPEMSVAPTSGLVGEWKLDETGGTTAADTKSGYDATVFGGAAFVAGKLGNGLNLNNGTAGDGGKYAEMPSNATLDDLQEGNYTISAWFYPYSVPPFTSESNKTWQIVGKQGQHMGLVYNNDGTFAARHYLTGNVLEIARSPVKPVNAWYHLVGAVNKAAGTLKLYLNGTLVATASFTPGTPAREYDTVPFRIGKAHGSPATWVADGKVDQVRFYNRELTSAEVGDLYNETVGQLGVPFGPYDLFDASGTLRTTARFNGTLDFTSPSSIVQQINAAEAGDVSFVPAMTGGGHGRYLTNPDNPSFDCPNSGGSGCQFDFAKWKAVQDSFNTTAIKAAVADAVSKGVIPFSNLMDEPNHSSWGGNVHHSTLDSMAAVVKGIFPTLKTGVAVTWKWENTTPYQNVDLIISQYSFSADTIVARYRDSARVSAQRQNVGLMFSLNLLDGGGRSFGTAAMSPAQVENFGKVLVAEPYACGLLAWKWDDAYMGDPANQTAFDSVAAAAARRPAKTCGR